MFKLQSPLKYSWFDVMHLLRCFSHCSKQLLNSLILMPFSASAFFCFTSSTSTKCFPLKTFFIQGNKKRRLRWWDQVNREGMGKRVMLFLVKNFGTLSGQVCSQITHHEMGKHIERVFQKDSLKLNAASRNNTSWSTDTDGFLEHSPSRGSLYYKRPSLQKIILVVVFFFFFFFGGGSTLVIT